MLAHQLKNISFKKRFAEEIITSVGQNGRFFFVKAAGRQGDDHGLGFGAVYGGLEAGRYLLGGLITVQDRHPHIHPDEMGLELLPKFHRLLPILSFSSLKTGFR